MTGNPDSSLLFEEEHAKRLRSGMSTATPALYPDEHRMNPEEQNRVRLLDLSGDE
jgi:hypothetical protein